MRVILKENIENLGRKGDIIEVAPGYGRNYLFPKKLAIEVTSSNMRMIEMEQQALKRIFEQEKSSYQELIQKMNESRLTFFRKTGEKDIIFGSVGSADIKDALEKLGIEIDKKKIILEEPIKRLGNYVVPIKVFHDERAEVKIEVVKEGEVPPQEAVVEEKEKVQEEIAREGEAIETKEEEEQVKEEEVPPQEAKEENREVSEEKPQEGEEETKKEEEQVKEEKTKKSEAEKTEEKEKEVKDQETK